MNNVRLFVHAAMIGDRWQEIIDEQVAYIEAVGLGDSLILQQCQPDNYEFPTLHTLWMYARQNPDMIIGYGHTKGVSHHKDGVRCQMSEDWREWLQWSAWENWRYHVNKVRQTYDVSGQDLRKGRWFPHPYFTGNFWWARASYIARLVDPLTYRHPDYELPVNSRYHLRFNAEFWIGSMYGKHEVTHFNSFAKSPAKPYRSRWLRHQYTDHPHPLGKVFS